MKTTYILSWREENPWRFFEEDYTTFEERQKVYDELLQNERVSYISAYKIVIEEEIEK